MHPISTHPGLTDGNPMIRPKPPHIPLPPLPSRPRRSLTIPRPIHIHFRPARAHASGLHQHRTPRAPASKDVRGWHKGRRAAPLIHPPHDRSYPRQHPRATSPCSRRTAPSPSAHGHFQTTRGPLLRNHRLLLRHLLRAGALLQDLQTAEGSGEAAWEGEMFSAVPCLQQKPLRRQHPCWCVARDAATRQQRRLDCVELQAAEHSWTKTRDILKSQRPSLVIV